MNKSLQTSLTLPWNDQWESNVKARLTKWSATLPETCPTHGEPTERTFHWEAHNDFGSQAGHRDVLLTCRFAPCPVCRLAKAGVPPLFQRCSFANFTATTSELRANLAKVREFAVDPHGFLLLLGTVGNGKSHLAASVLREFGRGLYFRHLDLVNRLRASYGHRDLEDDEDGIADVCRKADLLVVDELGVASGGNDAETLLYDILDHRVSHNGPTVLCANILSGDLIARFDERLADRFRLAAFAVLNFTAPSRRKSGNAAYLEQARAHARARRR